MLERKIYLSGICYGLYGKGTVVFSRRDEEPWVKKGNFYTISEVVSTEIGECGKNLLLSLEGITGQYNRGTFLVNPECIRMRTFKTSG